MGRTLGGGSRAAGLGATNAAMDGRNHDSLDSARVDRRMAFESGDRESSGPQQTGLRCGCLVSDQTGRLSSAENPVMPVGSTDD